MKLIVNILVIASCIVATGCVRRTVTIEPTFSNPTSKKRYAESHTKSVDQKTIWFWQDEFRNPQK